MVQVLISRSPKLWSLNPPGQGEGLLWALQIHTGFSSADPMEMGMDSVTSGRSSHSLLSTLKLLFLFVCFCFHYRVSL